MHVCLCVAFHCWLKINWLCRLSSALSARILWLGHQLGLKWPFIIHCQQQHSKQSDGRGQLTWCTGTLSHFLCKHKNIRQSKSQYSILSGLLLSTALWWLWCYRCCQTEWICGGIRCCGLGTIYSSHVKRHGEFSELSGVDVLRSGPRGGWWPFGCIWVLILVGA